MNQEGWRYFDEAEELFKLSQIDKARANIEKAEKYLPRNVQVLELFGRICFSQHDYSSAEQFFSQCYHMVQDDFSILYYYAMSLTELGQHEMSILLLRRCIEIDPVNNKALIALTDIYSLLGKTGKAIELLSAAVSDRPRNAQLWYHLACHYKNVGEYKKAVFGITQCMKESPNSKKALLLLYDLYLLCCDNETCEPENVFTILSDPAVKDRLCTLLAQSGKKEALMFLPKGILPEGFDLNTLLNVVRILLFEDDNHNSKDYLLKYLNSAPAASKTIYKLGSELLESNKNESALLCFDTCHQEEPYNPYVMRSICECLLRLNRYEELICRAKRFMDTNGFNSYLGFLIAKAYVKQENVSLAIRYMSSCIEESPYNHSLLSYMGYIYLLTGDIEMAKHYTELSLQFGPQENEKAQKNLARIEVLQRVFGTDLTASRQSHIRKHFLNNTYKDIHGVFNIPEDTLSALISGLKSEDSNIEHSVMKFRFPYKCAGYAGGRHGDGHIYDHITVVSFLRKEFILTAYPSD